MVDLHVQRWGSGPPVLLVHGSVMNGEMTWPEQRPLAERWELVVPDRRGYFPNPAVEREDFEVDAVDVAELLGDGIHLVGHSYGGIVSMLAAALRPQAVWSLTVIEPPAFGLVPDHPDATAIVEGIRDMVANGPHDPEAFLRAFLARVGSSATPPSPLPPPIEQNARLLMVERDPSEAVIPMEFLREAPFPTLVVCGDHSPAFTAVCDVLERGLEAERADIPGAGHSVQRTGAPFNDRLERFLREAERSRSASA